MFLLAQVASKRVPRVISTTSCYMVSYGLVCSDRSPFLSAFWPYLEHTWYSVLVHVPGTQMVFVVVLDTDPGVHSSVVRAADCRSAGPWFNSGWRSWFSFVTGSDNLTKQTAQRNNIMSPITTITRKSVKMLAELRNDTAPSRTSDTTDRLEGNSAVAKTKRIFSQ